MPEIVADGMPFEPPEEAVSEGYAQTPPADPFAARLEGVLQGGPIGYLGRASERGTA